MTKYVVISCVAVTSHLAAAWVGYLARAGSPSASISDSSQRSEIVGTAEPQFTVSASSNMGRSTVAPSGVNAPDLGLQRQSPPLESDGFAMAECLQGALQDTDGVLRFGRQAFEVSYPSCLRNMGANEAPGLGGRTALSQRGTCGLYSEELWSQAQDEIMPLMHSLRSLDSNGEPLHGSLFSQTDCDAMDHHDFAVASRVATVVSDWTDPEFFQCAVRREHRQSGGRSAAFFILLDAALGQARPESYSWLNELPDPSEQLQRRLQRLRSR